MFLANSGCENEIKKAPTPAEARMRAATHNGNRELFKPLKNGRESVQNLKRRSGLVASGEHIQQVTFRK